MNRGKYNKEFGILNAIQEWMYRRGMIQLSEITEDHELPLLCHDEQLNKKMNCVKAKGEFYKLNTKIMTNKQSILSMLNIGISGNNYIYYY